MAVENSADEERRRRESCRGDGKRRRRKQRAPKARTLHRYWATGGEAVGSTDRQSCIKKLRDAIAKQCKAQDTGHKTPTVLLVGAHSRLTTVGVKIPVLLLLQHANNIT